jgi:hypothetical protein
MRWVRSNWLIVLMCALILAAPPAFYVGANTWNEKIKTSRQTEVKTDWDRLGRAPVTYSAPAALPGERAIEVRRVPHAQLTSFFKDLRTRRANQIAEVMALALERNQGERHVLVEDLLPTPPERNDQVLRLAMQKKVVGTPTEPSAVEKLLESVNAGRPPDAEVLATTLNEFYAGELEKYEAEFGNADLSDEKRKELNEALVKRRIGEYQRRASELMVYANPGVMPSNLPRVEGGLPDIVDCFLWQWDLWVVQDVLEGIVNANTTATGERLTVPDAPVKRIVQLETLRAPGVFKDGPQIGSVSGSGPLIATDASASVTGRVSHDGNQLYDVRPVTLSLIVSSERLPEILDAISSTNFMSVIDLDVSRVDPWEDLKQGYYYGDEHVVRVDLTIETIWLRQWLKAYMPATVKTLMKVKDDA